MDYYEFAEDNLDTECQATLGELQKKYTKDVEPTPSITKWSRKNKE